MTVLLENRHNSIPFNRFKISGKNTKSLYYAIRILLGLSYTLSMLLFIPEDQEAALLQILRQILCPTKEFFTASGVYVVCIDEGYIKFLALFTVLGTLSEICQMAFFVLCCSYYLFFSKSSFTSKKTRKLQIAFFASIILQISIPITFLLPTFFYLGFSVGFKYYNQGRFLDIQTFIFQKKNSKLKFSEKNSERNLNFLKTICREIRIF